MSLRSVPTRYLFIIGAMKSGTTSLFAYLAQHPAICASSVKETGFFAFPDRWEQGTSWFADHFDYNPLVHRFALEASTDYTKRPYCTGVVERLQQLDGVECRFVYIMRNPLRRIESHTRHIDKTKREIGKIVLTRPDLSLNGGISDVWIDISRYAYQVQPYIEAFGRRAVHLTTLEELQSDPRRVVSEIFAFLGLEPFEVDTQAVLNKASDGKSPVALWAAAGRVPLLNRLYLTAVPPNVRSKLKNLVSVQSSGFGRYTLTKDEELYIIDKLRDDLSALSRELDIDVEGLWGIRAGPPPALLRQPATQAGP